MKNWFSIRNSADSSATQIDIFDEIGGPGVSVAAFAKELAAVPRSREITLRINSPGGSVFDGVAIYNLLAERRDRITAHVIGLAASMASVIMLAGKRTTAAANATIMIHNPAGLVLGESKDMRDMANVLDKARGPLVAAYAAKTKKGADEITKAMDATTWFTAEEAKAWGLVDEVTGAVRVAASFDLSKFGRADANRATAASVWARQFKTDAPVANKFTQPNGRPIPAREIWGRQFQNKS
jgi:ATP-dependent Clp protease protease subunit